jgi:hypothetical protein
MGPARTALHSDEPLVLRLPHALALPVGNPPKKISSQSTPPFSPHHSRHRSLSNISAGVDQNLARGTVRFSSQSTLPLSPHHPGHRGTFLDASLSTVQSLAHSNRYIHWHIPTGTFMGTFQQVHLLAHSGVKKGALFYTSRPCPRRAAPAARPGVPAGRPRLSVRPILGIPRRAAPAARPAGPGVRLGPRRRRA